MNLVDATRAQLEKTNMNTSFCVIYNNNNNNNNNNNKNIYIYIYKKNNNNNDCYKRENSLAQCYLP